MILGDTITQILSLDVASDLNGTKMRHGAGILAAEPSPKDRWLGQESVSSCELLGSKGFSELISYVAIWA